MKLFKVFLIILLINGCSSSDEPLPSEEQFSVLINGVLFTPDISGSASYYNKRLKFGAIDSIDKVNNDERFQIFFKIINPEIGINHIDNFSNTSSIEMTRWIGRQGTGFYATNGEFILTEFDTLNSRFSGTFNCVFDHPDLNIYYELTSGQFKDFAIPQLFCEPQLPYNTPDSTSLFNYWGLIGFKNHNGSYSYPPCETESKIKIVPDTLDSSITYFDGRAPINSFGFRTQILDNNSFETEGVASTQIGGSEWEMDYEDDLINFLSYETIFFTVQNNELILSNSTWSSQLVFKTIE